MEDKNDIFILNPPFLGRRYIHIRLQALLIKLLKLINTTGTSFIPVRRFCVVGYDTARHCSSYEPGAVP